MAEITVLTKAGTLEMVIKSAMQSKEATMSDTTGTAGVIMTDIDTFGGIMTDSNINGAAKLIPEDGLMPLS